jgi:CRISPR system Cascade subunit CasE
MIYLSRLKLDPFVRRVQKELAAPYEMHRTLCHAFPNLSKEEWQAARVLFRADVEKGQAVLLVQSKTAPNWEHFMAQIEGRYALAVPDVKAWTPKFESGQRLRFRLQANPTFAPKAEGNRSQRRGLYSEAERLDWLKRTGERCGFEFQLVPTTLRRNDGEKVVFRGKVYDELTLDLPLCEVVDLNAGRLASEKTLPHDALSRRTLPHPMPLRKHDRPFGACEFSAARFEGVLTVNDAEEFSKAVENGIGSAKGFGFGLLSLARA